MRPLTAVDIDTEPARSNEDVSLDSDVGSRGFEKCGGSGCSSSGSNGIRDIISNTCGHHCDHHHGDEGNDSDANFWACTSSIRRTNFCVSMRTRFESH
ncbi:hypothetical protein X777_11091 [Ooceraea biroi]|uniref:Uncharacterized protein n=1 Tax=Ooceraea biroi TaxID=2015173 RepID=A0A026W2M0_OOCBI|nr:hypothetical protein X777_11091 [Ooceraea biroi]